MNTAFVVCSRKHSSRVPNKAFVKYAGKTHIEHLVARLSQAEIPIHIAVPEGEAAEYAFLMDLYPKRVFVSEGFGDDPLRRMYGVAKTHHLDSIIRVTHDKIFVDQFDVFETLGKFNRESLDYIYSSNFIPGTGFEIISFSALEKAAKSFKRVEHISYAIKAITENKCDIQLSSPGIKTNRGVRLLVDYPEDVQLMNVIFATLGPACTRAQVLEFIEENPWVQRINRLPEVTVYTCAHNAERWIDQAMGSVAEQAGFASMEYILIDDCSTDRTAYKMAHFCQTFKGARWYRNQGNIGLASSSNKALQKARGKYIVRLDADDFFSSRHAIHDLVKEIKERNLDAVYPNNYLGIQRKEVQNGKDHHHIGGTLFKTAAINHVKFTEGLRNYDGLDFFTRAKAQIRIGYLNKPIFVYRQHPNSMSKTNLRERQSTKEAILSAMTGGPLLTKEDLDQEIKNIEQY